MSKDQKTPTKVPVEKGWQPSQQTPPPKPTPDAGYQPTTSEQRPVDPPPKAP